MDRNTKIQNERKKYLDYLDKKGLRLTTGRQIVFDETMHAHGHFTAEELVKQCKVNKRRVSRATIYRCIQELREACIIRETAFGEKHLNFEHVYDETLHHHARCIKCGSYIEVPDLSEEIKYKEILNKHNFQILGHELHFYGLCQKCQLT